MKKSDLKNGCVVELRNGDKGIKIDNILLVNFITKSIYLTRQQEFVYIDLGGCNAINLYEFPSNTQFKGMKLGKEYTLEELGLE